MIISYINADLDSLEYKQREESLQVLSGIFLMEIDKDIIIITERNPVVIRGIFTHYRTEIFMINSIKDFPFSPTQISELILFMLKNGCVFQTNEESIYFKEENIKDVYPRVFQYFRLMK